MRYTEPKILATHRAIGAIQMVESTNPIKPPQDFLDHAPQPVQCSETAYQADE
jgi:hypothetical protein